ncbi:AcrR family transcriptional regulator [Streptomyces olivoverticillatus]|uniref:AcrR family transcriptional regulator n=1 Tax=Streptomyces olivoverticillatus TaxID=66427 RepID=A0A7W7LLM0_9ACTN|nr:AcrR family transcriptional regulator [Streptomyces olivoverticillatus]
MPKRVDHDERRHRIAEALWRLASSRGLDGTSLRDVAAEAGISLGQLQHYFSSKGEMLLFALEHINKLAEARVLERVVPLPEEDRSPRRVLRESIAEMLPLNEESRTGNLVQIAYFVRAVHDERLRRHAREGIPALREFFAGQLRIAAQRGEIAAGRDAETEAMLLIALADGLTSYALLDVHSPGEALRLLDAHLDRLFTPDPR